MGFICRQGSCCQLQNSSVSVLTTLNNSPTPEASQIPSSIIDCCLKMGRIKATREIRSVVRWQTTSVWYQIHFILSFLIFSSTVVSLSNDKPYHIFQLVYGILYGLPASVSVSWPSLEHLSTCDMLQKSVVHPVLINSRCEIKLT